MKGGVGNGGRKFIVIFRIPLQIYLRASSHFLTMKSSFPSLLSDPPGGLETPSPTSSAVAVSERRRAPPLLLKKSIWGNDDDVEYPHFNTTPLPKSSPCPDSDSSTKSLVQDKHLPAGAASLIPSNGSAFTTVPDSAPGVSSVPTCWTSLSSSLTQPMPVSKNRAAIEQLRSEYSSSTAGSNKRISAQNLRGDPFRSAKVKTELCLHYKRGKVCPFGATCNYAHGSEELKYTTLMDMERAGLADSRQYRCQPCFTWTSTGACPFGQRCSFIHDPRLVGPSRAWLPHSDTPVSNLSTTINVDKDHAIRSKFDPPSQWLHAPKKPPLFFAQRGTDGVIEEERKSQEIFGGVPTARRLQVYLRLHEALHTSYVYSPNYFLGDELVMIHSKHLFEPGIDNDFDLQISAPFPPSEESSKMSSVYDVSFGPRGSDKTAACDRMLLFNLDQMDIREVTSSSIKKHRREKRNMNVADGNCSPSVSPVAMCEQMSMQVRRASAETCSTTICPSLEPAHVEYHHMKRLYELNCLLHELLCVKDRDSRELKYERVQFLIKSYNALMDDFIRFTRSAETWFWPISTLREDVDESTPVPEVDSEYVMHDEVTVNLGSYTSKTVLKQLYTSFLLWAEGSDDGRGSTSYGVRLNVFKALEDGIAFASEFPIDLFRISYRPPWEGLFSAPDSRNWKLVIDHYPTAKFLKTIPKGKARKSGKRNRPNKSSRDTPSASSSQQQPYQWNLDALSWEPSEVQMRESDEKGKENNGHSNGSHSHHDY